MVSCPRASSRPSNDAVENLAVYIADKLGRSDSDAVLQVLRKDLKISAEKRYDAWIFYFPPLEDGTPQEAGRCKPQTYIAIKERVEKALNHNSGPSMRQQALSHVSPQATTDVAPADTKALVSKAGYPRSIAFAVWASFFMVSVMFMMFISILVTGSTLENAYV